MNKGNLMYQMSDSIYFTNRKRDLWARSLPILIIILSLIILILYTISIMGLFTGILYLVIGVLGLIFVYFDNILNNPFKTKLFRLAIYENGISPEYKPLTYLLRRKEFFILFEDIVEIEYISYGQVCKTTLDNGKEYPISSYSNDIDGYLTFCKLISERFPDVKRPNLDIVEKCDKIHKMWLNKVVKEKEYDKCFDEMMEVNKDFA